MSAFGSILPVALLAAGLLTACNDAPSAASETVASSAAGQASAPTTAPPPSQPTLGPSDVVAEVGGRKITLAEVDQKWAETDAGEKARVAQMLYQNRRNILDQVIGDALIAEAAKAAGVAVDAYIAQDTAKRAQPATEAEIKQFFDQNAERTQGRTLDQLRPAIKEFIEAQRRLQARAQLVEDLKKKSGGVRVMLEPPRQTVEIAATDAVKGDPGAAITIVEFSDYQ